MFCPSQMLSRCLALAMEGLSHVTFLFVMFLQGRAPGNGTDIHISLLSPSPYVPVRAARSQKVFIGMEFNNIHWAGVSCKLKH